jgi:hypothetical protein
VAQNVTVRQQRVLRVLAEKPDGDALREILASLDVAATERQVGEDLAVLKFLGLANSEGHVRGARWKLL